MHYVSEPNDQLSGEPGRSIRAAAQRVMGRCDELATCSDDPHRLTRTFCSEAMRQAHERISAWMHELSMTTTQDSLGNLFGRFESGLPGSAASPQDARTFIIGSHLDTVIDAGKFDGSLGVLLGIAAVEILSELKCDLPFALDIVGFSEEEGVRFGTPYLGSRALTGVFDAQLFDLADADGCTMRQALIAFGSNPDLSPHAHYALGEVLGFLEPHIEQGPILERESRSIAVVSSIVGQTRATFEFTGSAGHAGTVPHSLRRDALAAAAEFIVQVEQLGQQTEGLVATVGMIQVEPNVSNVIAGKARVRIDLRHELDAVRLAMYDRIQGIARACGDRRCVELDVTQCEQQSAVAMAEGISEHLEAACKDLGLCGCRLVSGAGHDAALMAQTVPTGMLFLRCRGGISHHPDEHVDVGDVEIALDVIVRSLLRISQQLRQQDTQPND